MDMLTTIACNQVPLPITPDADEQPLSNANAATSSMSLPLSLSHSLSASHAELGPSTPSPRLNGLALGPPLSYPSPAGTLAQHMLGGGGGEGLDPDASATGPGAQQQLRPRLNQHSRTGSLAEVPGNNEECAPVQRSGGSTGTCPPNCSGCPTHPNSTFCKGTLLYRTSPSLHVHSYCTVYTRSTDLRVLCAYVFSKNFTLFPHTRIKKV